MVLLILLLHSTSHQDTMYTHLRRPSSCYHCRCHWDIHTVQRTRYHWDSNDLEGKTEDSVLHGNSRCHFEVCHHSSNQMDIPCKKPTEKAINQTFIGGVNPVWLFSSKRLTFIVSQNDLINYFTICLNISVIRYIFKKQLNVFVVLEIWVVLLRIIVLTLFETSLRNHRIYRDSIAPVGSLANLLIKYHQLLSTVLSINRKSCFKSFLLYISLTPQALLFFSTNCQILSHRVPTLGK